MTGTIHNAASATVLTGHNYMNLTTFRKNGRAVITPVWFAQDGDRLYVTTEARAGKIKRIRNNGRVEVGPSDRRGRPIGPVLRGQARLLEGGEAAHAAQMLNRKYGLSKRLFDLLLYGLQLLRRHQTQAYLEIVVDAA